MSADNIAVEMVQFGGQQSLEKSYSHSEWCWKTADFRASGLLWTLYRCLGRISSQANVQKIFCPPEMFIHKTEIIAVFGRVSDSLCWELELEGGVNFRAYVDSLLL